MPDPTLPISAPALVGRRVFARLFDIFAVAVFVVPVLALTLRDDNDGGVRFPLVVIVLYGLLPALLEARLLVHTGRTPGKRLSGLAVRDPHGGLPDPGRAVLRSALAWSLPALVVLLGGWIGVLASVVGLYGPALATGGRADLPDLVSGTRVVFTGDVSDAD